MKHRSEAPPVYQICSCNIARHSKKKRPAILPCALAYIYYQLIGMLTKILIYK